MALMLLTPIAAAAAAAPPPPGYEPIPALSDEFDGDGGLDGGKWDLDTSSWRGRQPGLFDPANVKVADGKLQLWARAAKRNGSWPAGYDNYTTATVRSLAAVREGFFEIRWRSGSSGISSSWWFTGGNDTTGRVEIDVFETTGEDNVGPGDPESPDWCATTPLGKCRTGCPADPHGTCGPEKQPFPHGGPSCNMCPCNRNQTICSSEMTNTALPSHVHIWALPDTPLSGLPAKCGCVEGHAGKAPCSKGSTAKSKTAFSAEFHVASLNWTESEITVAVDGAIVNTIDSPCMVADIKMLFDRETMPDWMKIPDPATLPDRPFEVDWVRAWRRAKPPAAKTDDSPSPFPIPAVTATDFTPPAYMAPPYLTNGFIGMSPEPIPFLQPGRPTLVAGYEQMARNGDQNFGTPALSPAPYPLKTEVEVGGVSISQKPELVKVLSQTLNLSNAELTTELSFEPTPGASANITVVQLLSRSLPCVALQRLTVRPSKTGLAVKITSNLTLEGSPGTLDTSAHPHPQSMQQGAITWDASLAVRSDTGSALGMAVTTQTTSPADGDGTVQVDTYASFVSQIYFERSVEVKAIGMVNAAVYQGFDTLRRHNQRAWAELWKSRATIEGPNATAADQQTADFALFYIASSTHPTMKTAVPPYGLSGPYYWGNLYWDWDISMALPATLISPAAGMGGALSKAGHLDLAMDNARLFGRAGAFFPDVGSQVDGADAGLPTAKDSAGTEEHTALDSAIAVWETALIAGDPVFTAETAWVQ